MSAYARKLLLAAALSIAGILLSFLWYKYDLAKSSRGDDNNRRLLAHLDSSKNEVQKRSVKRVIWQSIGDEEPLFAGEAVRTGPDAEAKIVFKSGAEVDLEPDSVVVIDDSDGKVALDFVKGNLFVKGGGGEGGLALKSGNTSINLSNADVSLGRGSGQDINLQVMRGTAQVSAGDKTLTLDQNNAGRIGAGGVDVQAAFFKISSPQATDRVYIRGDQKEAIGFNFRPVADDFDIRLEVGSKREVLKPMGTVVKGSVGQIKAILGQGTQYWRLVATNRKDPKQIVFSPTNKLVVVADTPPKIITPVKDSRTALNAETKALDVRWANPSKLIKLQLELAKDSNFKNLVATEFVDDTGVYSLQPKGEGEYFLRISGLRPGTAIRINGEVVKFNLSTSLALDAPQLKVPANEARISFEKVMNGGAFLVWETVPGVTKYRLKVDAVQNDKPQNVFEKEVDVTQIRIPNWKAGTYKWFVESIDSKGKHSQPSAVRTFAIEDLPRLVWADGKLEENHQYATLKPSVTVQWKANQAVKAAKFVVAVQAEGEDSKKEQASNGLMATVEVPTDGKYLVRAIALDANGKPVAQTDFRKINVIQRPLLPAPNFQERMPASLVATKKGAVGIGWTTVKGAKQTAVILKAPDGKVMKTDKFDGSQGTLTGLLPGQYQVSLASVDESGRMGPAGQARELRVPDTSDVRAPGFKKLKIK
ncbi:MAG: FecR domain-containing protein [Oligoflexia bacterium]|nr:FecR domain-containing protein [Oligoflexia bacterium]